MVRQAHPGERREAYQSYQQKVADAREFQHLEEIAWPVLVDDLAATVHRLYGGMSDPVYLIDRNGRVAFYGMWIDGSRLKQAIDELLAQGGQGAPVAGGMDRRVHLAPAIVEGWRTMSRGGGRAVWEFALAFPPVAVLVALGYVARPLLRPLVLRTTPLPLVTQLMLLGALAGSVAFVVQRWRRPRN